MRVLDPASQKDEAPDTEACWSLIERVVASSQFRRTARMREFLLYVGRRSLKEACDQIPEIEIGSEVFGRPIGYDTSADNIVRVIATDLRKRIEAYFEAEGAHEPLILDIPRGSYKPVFHYRAVAPPIVEPKIEHPIAPSAPAIVPPISAAPASVPVSRPTSDRKLLVLAGVIIAALTIACWILWLQNRAMRGSLYAWRSTPSVGSFWSGILAARPNTDIILADTSFSLIEDITKKPISLNDYLNRDYLSQLQSQDLSQDRRDDLNLIVKRNYGSLGDFRATQRIVALDPLGKIIHLYYARDYTPSLIKQDNVILIGSRKSNPWVDLFERTMNFSVEYDPNRYVSFVRNRAPLAGEQEIYTSPPAPDPNSGYSVVAYLPNKDQSGKVLILAGTGSEATEAGGEFITSEDQLARFQSLLHMTALPYFEVLLRTSHLNGTPMDATIVAYRTYPNLH
jgi:hypothetical protein